MALSKGFISQFFAGDNLEGLTPILQVAKSRREETGVVWFLTDGESTQQFVFKNESGPRENLVVGVRVILLEYYLNNNKRKMKMGMVKRFLFCSFLRNKNKFKFWSLYCPNSRRNMFQFTNPNFNTRLEFVSKNFGRINYYQSYLSTVVFFAQQNGRLLSWLLSDCQTKSAQGSSSRNCVHYHWHQQTHCFIPLKKTFTAVDSSLLYSEKTRYQAWKMGKSRTKLWTIYSG